MESTAKKIPVWFFVGILVAVHGLMVFGSGIYWYFVPSNVVLAELHANLWWGVIMSVFGIIFVLKHGPWKNQD